MYIHKRSAVLGTVPRMCFDEMQSLDGKGGGAVASNPPSSNTYAMYTDETVHTSHHWNQLRLSGVNRSIASFQWHTAICWCFGDADRGWLADTRKQSPDTNLQWQAFTHILNWY